MEKCVQAVMDANSVDPKVQAQVKEIIMAESGKTESIFKEAITNSATQGGKRIVTELKNNHSIEVKFSKFSKQTERILKDKAFTASDNTMNKVIGSVMDSLKTSYNSGYGINKAALNLRNEFGNLTDRGLRRIARTEINSAQNLGAHQTLVDLGTVYEQWWTAEDDRVRDGTRGDADHASLHGQITRVGDNFENGLLYPGDMNGDIGEWIECRCTQVPFIMPLGMQAPDSQYFFESDLVPVEDKKN